MQDYILKATVEYGFAGLAAAQFVVLIWLVRRLLVVFEQTAAIIASNTHALHSLDEKHKDLAQLNQKLSERVLSRPCLRK